MLPRTEMPAVHGERSSDVYELQIVRQVAARAPLGFTIFLVSLALSTFFEILRFPERAGWMTTFAGAFVVCVALAWTLVRRRPLWSVYVLITFVNAVGLALNVYHVIVGASVAMCIWTLTGLLGASAVVLPWGGRSQAFACLGALLAYPLHLEAGTADPLTWAAGGTYLLVVSAISVFGAALFASYVRSDLELTAVLSEREARLQSYFDLSLVGTAILLPDGTCNEVNDELCTMLGFPRGELVRRWWPALVHKDERAAAAALLARALADGAPERRDMRCVRKDGTEVHTTVSIRGLSGARGAIDHVLLLVHDVTERTLAAAERERYLARAESARLQAEQASRAKDAFLATVSHELRTPLTPILAWSGVLREGGLTNKSSTAALAAIERNARTQARLIDDLLDVSRIVSGAWRLTLHRVEVGPVVRAAVDVVRPAADAKAVTVDTIVPLDPIVVQGDADRLQQVVWNLLSNAIKFTPRGGRVDVAVERVGGRARITVRDTGEGISAAFLPHVFDWFRQADASTTRHHGGLGLGLAIVRALVEHHGGTVRAESAGAGCGARFTVELPLAAADEAGATAEPSESDPAVSTSLGGLHVLVVDDDPDSNAVVSAVLTGRGADVRTAVSTREALDIVTNWQPDVLVSDIAMPGDDGYALLQKVRARDDRLARVPVVALTAYAAASDRTRMIAAGFDAHVAKPFDPRRLAAVVESAARAHVPPAA